MVCAPKHSAPRFSECPAPNSCPLPLFHMSEKFAVLQKCVKGVATSEAETIAHACFLSLSLAC